MAASGALVDTYTFHGNQCRYSRVELGMLCLWKIDVAFIAGLDVNMWSNSGLLRFLPSMFKYLGWNDVVNIAAFYQEMAKGHMSAKVSFR